MGRKSKPRKSAIGKKLLALRERLNLTLEEAGEAVGVAKDTWLSWEHGRRKPNAAYLKLVDFLDSGVIKPRLKLIAPPKNSR